MNYVMIGNSAAAIGCVEGIRQRDSEGAITIIASEPHHTYSRPLISYLLQGKTDRDRMRYRGGDFYQDNNCKLMLGRAAQAIDSGAKTVQLDGGETVAYDKLLVAAGSTPVVPPIDGLDTVTSRHTFMTLDDASALEQAVNQQSRVLILGAGLIGLKCAEGLRDRAGRITVVDLADHVLPSILDRDAAERLQRHLAGQGLELVLGQSVEAFAGNQARLTGGGNVEFDVLVVAVGVRPNTALIARAGGEVARGIVTDSFCRTSLPDVYAAGDCTESLDISSGERRVLALLPGAYRQGECAGLHMTGLEQPYDKAIPMNAVGFFGQHIITAGCYEGEEYKVAADTGYKRLFYKDDLLKGYILMGDVARAGIYTALIRERVPLSSLDWELIKERPQLMAFSKKERVKKLGGVSA